MCLCRSSVILLPVAISCEIPAGWNQAYVNVTTNDPELMIGAVVQFLCNSSDYQLDPPESTSSTCLQNKTWSRTFPTCQECEYHMSLSIRWYTI